MVGLHAQTDEGRGEGELPDCEQDVVEELEADVASEEGGVGGAADGGATGVHGTVGVSGAGGGAEDVDEGYEGFGALLPEELAGFLSAQEGGVFLDRNVLEAGVLGFGEGGEVFV